MGVAGAITSALSAAVSPAALAAAFLAWWREREAAGATLDQLPAAAREWAAGYEREHPAFGPAIGRAFADAYAQGWLAGRDAARRILEHEADTGESVRQSPGFPDGVEWRWSVGDAPGARRVLDEMGDGGPERFWRDNAHLMRATVRARIDDIARILADGVRRGQSGDAIARRLRAEVLDDPKWARKVAITETNRAISAGTLLEYRLSGVPGKEWMNAHDQRVCKDVCAPNELAGPIGLDDEFPSGDMHPPGHPWCRCGLIPAYRMRQ